MSWILGFIGASLSPERRERLAAFCPPEAIRAEGAGHFIAGAGLPETFLCGRLANPLAGWAVAGLGLRVRSGYTAHIKPGQWETLLAGSGTDLERLDGHFVALRWITHQIEIFTDQLGVRTLYLTRLPDGTAFSTRLDWIAGLMGGCSLNLEAFGAHWLTFNQLSCEALVQGVERLGPGGYARCTAEGFKLNAQPWSPAPLSDARRAFENRLASLLHPRLPRGHSLSLGLSGGLDSRLLLAMRQGHHNGFATHVFGTPEHPDAVTARTVAKAVGAKQYNLHDAVPDADACLRLLHDQVVRTQAVSPASSVLGLRYYPSLYRRNAWVVDGGFGEIGRRQFMNRLLRRGRGALRSGDPVSLLPFLRVHRVDVFSEETNALLRVGALRQIDSLWQSLQPFRSEGDEAFLDLIGVRARLPNFFGYEQNRLDEQVPSYMPYAQPSFLEAVFSLPLPLRRNGRLYRQLIRSSDRRLAQTPLVKGDLTYPFFLPTLPAYFWTRYQASRSTPFPHTTQQVFLHRLKTYALDTATSNEVRQHPLYDANRLEALLNAYYNGQRERALEVDWWLAFEVWRQAMENARGNGTS